MIFFGAAALNTTVHETVTLKNVGVVPVSGDAVFLDGAVFSIVGDGTFQLQPGMSRILILSFTPNQEKVYTDTLQIGDGKHTYSLLINGIGASNTISCDLDGVSLPPAVAVIGDVAILLLFLLSLFFAGRR